MCRFVALLWKQADLSAKRRGAELSRTVLRTHRPWSCVVRSETMIVLCCDSPQTNHVHTLQDNGGVILGQLFPSAKSSTPAAITDIPPESSREIVSSDGRALLTQYWGSYIAFIHNDHSDRQSVIRDCSGAIPCFRIRDGALDIFFSDTSDLRTIAARPPGINWPYLATYLIDTDARVRETGLIGVHELLAGDCWSRSDSIETQRCIWTPAKIWSSGAIDNYDLARAELRDTTQRCIDSWSTVHRRLLLRLSGGLDSAIVLSCLSHGIAPPVVSCVNRYDDEPGGDERYYARLAAEKCGTPLIEHPWATEPTVFGERLFSAPQLPKPVVESVMFNDTALYNELAMTNRAEAVWTGQGGDHIFLQPGNAAYAADYLRLRGVRREFLSVVRDVASLTGDTYWSVLASAIQGAAGTKRKPRASLPLLEASFIAPDAVPSDLLERLETPWSVEASDLPPGKRFHAALLAGLVNRLSPIRHQEVAPEHHPLISQPLLETCVRIPTYVLSAGGVSRGLARSAFRGYVPDAILKRRSKGETTQFTVGLIRENRRFLEELLLDGQLVREKLIARDDITKHVSGDRPLGTMQLFPMLACVTAELWARYWARAAREHMSHAALQDAAG